MQEYDYAFENPQQMRRQLLQGHFYYDHVQMSRDVVRLRTDWAKNRTKIWLAERIFEAHRIFSTRCGMYKTVVTHISTYADYTSVSGDVIHIPTGKKAGDWSRSLYYHANGRANYVEHDSFDMYQKHQGNGFGRAWMKRCFKRYREYDFKYVQVTAAGTSGRYTWARIGFDFEHDDDRDLWGTQYEHFHTSEKSDSHRQVQMLKIIERARKKGTDPKTVEIAKHVVRYGVPKDMPLRKVAMLGKNGPWRNRQRQHLGQALMLSASGWDGRYDLRKAS